MDKICEDFENCLKLSAFRKVRKVNDHVKDITIGPDATRITLEKKEDEKRTSPIKTNDRNLSNENVLPMKFILKELDVVRQDQVKDAMEARLNKIRQFSTLQENLQKQQWVNHQQAFINDMLQKENEILEAQKQHDLKNKAEHEKLVKHYKELAVNRKKQELALQEKEKQKEKLLVNIEQIKINENEFRAALQQVLNTIKLCPNVEELKLMLPEEFKELNSLPELIEEIVNKCKTINITDEEVNATTEILNKLNILKMKIEESVKEINKKQRNTVEVPVEKQSESQQVIAVSDSGNKLNEVPNSKPLTITKYISVNNVQKYAELMEFLENHTKSFMQLQEDVSLKQFKFDCKKAVNIPVNAISGVNPDHILDKYNRLYNLLSGKNVMVGDKQFNASQHSQGIAFCMDLLAKKFILQGDLMVSSNPESAFCYASVIVSLWNDFPVLGQLILAYFYKSCPYLVPYYIPREVGESDEQYYLKQGYQYNDGQIEKQDKFLKRMTGIMRLYAAILITKPKRGQTTSPYNLKHGWQWIACFLKLEPRVDITPTMLHVFLETVGFKMENTYGVVFQKILKIITEQFLPQCRTKCTGGAATRLELLIGEYMKNKRFERPKGYNDFSNW